MKAHNGPLAKVVHTDQYKQSQANGLRILYR